MRCRFCDAPVDALETGYVVLYGMPGYSYPNEWQDVLVAVAHTGCLHDDDAGYQIALPDLLRDGLDGARGWLTHLRSKRWWNETQSERLRAVHAVAEQIRRTPARAPGVDVGAALFTLLARPTTPDVPRRSAPTKPKPAARLISTRTRAAIMERDGFRCRRCGATGELAPLVVDHIVPVAKGGGADPANLQTLCTPCNAGKSDREPHPHDLRGRA